MQDLVSVIIPVYNGENTIENAICSVQQQTYSNLQIIVVDDCSSDNTYKIVERLAEKDQRIKLLGNKSNMGVSVSRNRGCNEAIGEYIAFLDSDDIWYSKKIERQLESLKMNKADFCYTSYEIMEKDSKSIMIKYKVAEKVNYKALLKENFICCSSVLIKTDIMKKNPFISQYFHEDFILWLTLLKQGYIAVGVSEYLVTYRKGGRSANKVNAVRNRWKIYIGYEHLNILMAIYYFIWYAINGVKKYYLIELKNKVLKR